VNAVATAIDGLTDRALVVVQRGEAGLATYCALDVGSVRLALDGVDAGLDLASALGLGVFPANRLVDLEDVIRVEESPAQRLRPGDVLLRNVQVLGVVRTDPGEVTRVATGSAALRLSPGSPVREVPVEGLRRDRHLAGQGATALSRLPALNAPSAVGVGSNSPCR